MNSSKKQKLGFRRQRRTGATAVEFALVAPIFFMFIAASFEFSRLNVIRHTADNAAYEAARKAIVPGATSAEAVTKANDTLRVVNTVGAVVTVNPTTLGPDTEEVTVTVNVLMDQNGWIIPRLIGSRTIQSSSTLQTERTGQ